MAGIRNRSTWSSQSAIPRLGFLLYILALAIVVWPKLRLVHEGAVPRIPDPEGTTVLNSADTGSSTLVTSDQLPEKRDSENNLDLNILRKPEEDLELDSQSRDLLSLVTDNTLRMSKREMPAYWALVRKSANSSFNQLHEKANPRTKFNDFYSDPAKHRGELVSLDIVVRRVTRFEADAGNSSGVSSVYEIWGSTDQSHAWLYVFITDRLPNGFDEETLLRKKTAFAGYFLKLLAYQPGSAPPNAKPLVAPLLVGRFDDITQSSPSSKENFPVWASWGLTTTIVLMAVFFSVRVFRNAKQAKRTKRDRRIDLNDLPASWFQSDMKNE